MYKASDMFRDIDKMLCAEQPGKTNASGNENS